MRKLRRQEQNKWKNEKYFLRINTSALSLALDLNVNIPEIIFHHFVPWFWEIVKQIEKPLLCCALLYFIAMFSCFFFFLQMCKIKNFSLRKTNGPAHGIPIYSSSILSLYKQLVCTTNESRERWKEKEKNSNEFRKRFRLK